VGVQAFNAGKSVNRDETRDCCFACHRGQAKQHVFALDLMKSVITSILGRMGERFFGDADDEGAVRNGHA
jgi:hypothetical protein